MGAREVQTVATTGHIRHNIDSDRRDNLILDTATVFVPACSGGNFSQSAKGEEHVRRQRKKRTKGCSQTLESVNIKRYFCLLRGLRNRVCGERLQRAMVACLKIDRVFEVFVEGLPGTWSLAHCVERLWIP